MIICHCHAVCHRQIDAVIAAGATDVDDVTRMCEAGGTCGSCRPEIEERMERRVTRVLLRTA